MKKLLVVFLVYMILQLTGCTGILPTANSLPEVITKDAEMISEKCAWLQGQILNDGGGCTEVGFNYYKDGDIENSLNINNEDNFTCENFGIALPTDSLEPETKYFFRAYAKNTLGIGYGDWRDLITLASLPDTNFIPPPPNNNPSPPSTEPTPSGNVTVSLDNFEQEYYESLEEWSSWVNVYYTIINNSNETISDYEIYFTVECVNGNTYYDSLHEYYTLSPGQSHSDSGLLYTFGNQVSTVQITK
jgi:hypothetical protein